MLLDYEKPVPVPVPVITIVSPTPLALPLSLPLPLPLELPPALPRSMCSLVSIKNNKGSTALHFACYAERSSEESLLVAKALLVAGSEVDAADSRGLTPLLVCCTSGR